MSNEVFFKEMSKVIVELERERALKLAQKAINENYNILDVIEKGLGEGIHLIGELWENDEIFLPELMMAAKIMEECLDLLLPHLPSGENRKILGKVVIATIEGDIHSIGKTIVATMLTAYGFEVFDLGADVKAEKIIEKAINEKADIIGVSALLTTTMVGQKKVVEILEKMGKRNDFKVILGGAPVSDKWVKACGADGYAENAITAIKLVKRLIEVKETV